MTKFINPILDKLTPFMVMEVLEKAHQMEKSGISVIHMEVGEPDFNMPTVIANSFKNAVDKGYTHYTHSLGSIELRQTIANYYQKKYGVNINPNHIIVTSGSSAAILLSLMVLCGYNDEVIISNPGYPCYRNFILTCNANPVEIGIHPSNGYQYDISKIKTVINDKTKAIIVNSPMNPTGTLTDKDVFKQLASINIPVISDEIYHGLVYNEEAHSILEFTDKAFVIGGFSKKYAMTGLRIGYLIAPENYIRPLQILQQNLFICAPSVAQEAAIAALNHADDEVAKMVSIYNQRRIYMIERLKNIGFKIETEPHGAFYIYANATKFTRNSYQFAFDVLENAHVGITPGTDFGSNGEGYIRFSYANSIENLTEGLNRLEKYLKNS